MNTTTVAGDNQGALKILREPKQSQKMPKHVDVRYLFVREKVAESGIQLVYVQTDQMIADILTKPFAAQRFMQLRAMIMPSPTTASTNNIMTRQQ